MDQNFEKTRIPKQKRSIRTKEKILTAAMNIFAGKGFYNTNSNEISSAAGVSTGSFYAYFRDKKHLFLEAMNYYDKQIMEQLKSKSPSDYKSKKELLESQINSILQAHRINPEFHRELNAMQLMDPEIEKRVEEQEKLAVEYMRGYLEIYKDQIRVEDLEAASYVVYKTAENLIHKIVFSGNHPDESSLIRELLDMLSRYLFED